jgi:hypothetical protein
MGQGQAMFSLSTATLLIKEGIITHDSSNICNKQPILFSISSSGTLDLNISLLSSEATFSSDYVSSISPISIPLKGEVHIT